MIVALARKLFGSSSESRIKRYTPRVARINALEKDLEKLSDDALRARTEAQSARDWLQARESNSAAPAYETGRVTRPLPAMNGGAPTCRSPHLSVLIRLERRPEAAPVDLAAM